MEVTPLLFAAAAAVGNVLGAAAVVRAERRGLAAIHLLLAFGAGFMLALVLVGVFPRLFRGAEDPGLTGVLVLSGYLVVHLTQHALTPHFHFGEETHPVPRSAGGSAVAGLLLHALFDGVAVVSGFLVSWSLGLMFFLAILLHKLPEGVSVASVMLASGLGRRLALQAGLALGLATVVGAALTDLIEPLARYGLALAAGVTLYVAASNLVPEVQASRGAGITAALLGGSAALLLLRGLAPV
ncbi:MAG: ZIP family metal transporter [Gemmatimonadales bacterium]